MHNSEKKNWKTAVELLLLILYIGLHVFILINHEAFRDEAQAWTIAKNTTLRELFADLCIEGHPCLWYLIIRPFAKLGLSYRYFGIISMVFMGISAAVLLWKSPFPLLLKAVVLFSFAFCYNSPVMPRTYCVITLLIVLLAMLWPRRMEKSLLYGSLIGLLFQSHIILAGFAGGLVLELLIRWIRGKCRDRKLLCGILIPCGSALLTGAELYQRPDVPKYVNSTASSLLSRLELDPQKILDSIYELEETVWGESICEAPVGPVTGKTLLLLVFLGLLAALIAAVFARRRWGQFGGIFLVGLCGFGFALGVRLFIYSGGYHMTVCYFLMLIFLAWAVFATMKERSIRIPAGLVLAVALVLTCAIWIPGANYDLQHAYSGSKATADMIRDTLPEGSVIAVKQHHMTPSVSAYTDSDRKDITFWSIDTKDPFQIFVWGAEYPSTDAYGVVLAVEEAFPELENCYYLSCGESAHDERLKLFYSFEEENPLEENYWLYQVLP